jgi:hypothetical protein
MKRVPKVLMRSSLCVLALGIGAHASSAQSVRPLASGERVQIAWRDAALAGPHRIRIHAVDVVRVEGGVIVGRTAGETQVIAVESIHHVRRRVGSRPATAPELVGGSAIGFATMFVASLVGGRSTNDGLSSGVLVGAPVGALVAWIRSRGRGIYEDVPIPVSFTLSPSARVGVAAGLTVR